MFSIADKFDITARIVGQGGSHVLDRAIVIILVSVGSSNAVQLTSLSEYI
jgi:hypothetical protein